MGKFAFKSVGKTSDQITSETVTVTEPPIGIKTPMALGGKEGIFAMNYDLADQLHDNLRNLILTNWGERVGLYSFGGNLRPLTTELVSLDDFDTQAITRIKNAVGRWMPFIDLQNFSSMTDHTENKDTAVINIQITYNIPSLNVTNKALIIKLFAI